jgi:hypothetical protein
MKKSDEDDEDEFPPRLTCKSVLGPIQPPPIPCVQGTFFSEGKAVGA